jgi:GTP cyclohydrolase I
MTQQIAEAVQETVNPLGVGVVVDAAHFCMMMRGVQKQNSSTMTSCLLGAFRSSPATRSEFLGLIRNLGG